MAEVPKRSIWRPAEECLESCRRVAGVRPKSMARCGRRVAGVRQRSG